MKNVYVYKGFERFWHWSQTTLISALLITGIEVHGSFKLFGFENVVMAHNILAWLLIALIVFAIFWHITTGEWKQYIPTTEKLIAVMRFYGYGIFRGEHHPSDKTLEAKINPLQRIAYLQLKLLIIPLQLLTGFIYFFYNDLSTFTLTFLGFDITRIITLELIAISHTLCAYGLAMFIIIHVYMITTGHTVLAHVKSMITGWEELHDDHGEHKHDHHDHHHK